MRIRDLMALFLVGLLVMGICEQSAGLIAAVLVVIVLLGHSYFDEPTNPPNDRKEPL